MDGATYLQHAEAHFAMIKRRADRALAQVPERAFATRIGPESNSLALVVKHVAGNLRSRWTDFLTADGEKPDRRRDEEFVVTAVDTRERLLDAWEKGWALLFRNLARLVPGDLERQITIRGEPYSVFAALERQKDHNSYHAGQIVFLAKHLAGSAWSTLSVPLGGSDAYNAEVRARMAGGGPPA